MARRTFGKIRKLPSGKFQASYIGPDGQRHNAPFTFPNRPSASRWLSGVETDMSLGGWFNVDLGKQPFGVYALRVLDDKLAAGEIGERWAETCRRNLRLHMATLKDKPMRSIGPATVREWHGAALRNGAGRTVITQSYRFLKATMSAGVREGAVIKNPCMVKKAGSNVARERQTATPDQIQKLVDAISPAKYRAAVLLAAWASLRRGEVCAVLTADVDLQAGTVRVRKSRAELLESDKKYDKDPKSEAGKRLVHLPPHVLPYFKEHAEKWSGRERFFVDSKDEPMRGNTVYQAYKRARKRVGLEHLTFHDLRHTGATLAGAAGANMADLRKRLGDSTDAAARLYLHSVDGRDEAIAKRLSEIAQHGDVAQLPDMDGL